MIRSAFAIVLLALGFTAVTPARAYRFLTFEGADAAMHQAVAMHRCYHWW